MFINHHVKQKDAGCYCHSSIISDYKCVSQGAQPCSVPFQLLGLKLVVILVYENYLYSDSREHFSSLDLHKKMSTKSQRKLFDDYSSSLSGRWIEKANKLST